MNKIITLLLLLLVLRVASQVEPVCFNVPFPSISQASTVTARAINSADFDNDGKLDIVIYQSNIGLKLFYGLGNGKFTNPSLLSGNLYVPDPHISCDDLNNDGKKDIVVTMGGNDSIVVLLSNTTSFSPPVSYYTPVYPLNTAIGDVNGDGYKDIITSSFFLQGNISVLLGSNTGIFGAVTTYTFNGPVRWVSAGDFNSDGYADVAVTINPNKLQFLLGNSTGSLTLSPNTNTMSSSQNYVTTADFNGDSKLDLAITGSGVSCLSFLNGDGLGTFTTASTYSFAGVTSLKLTNIADYNSDGKLDIAVTNETQGGVIVLTNLGNTSFSVSSTLIVNNNPTGITSGDFNGDTRPDIVSLNNSSNGASTFLNTGNGNFLDFPGYNLRGNATSLVVSDINNDNKSDVVVASENILEISVLFGNSLGSFSAVATQTLIFAPKDIFCHDFNGDSFIDIAAISQYSTNSVRILFGNGTGSYSLTSSYSISTIPAKLKAADFNNDGVLDLITTSNTSAIFYVLLGNTNGTFSAPVSYSVSGIPNEISIGDYNLDGKKDLALTIPSGNQLLVLIGNGNGSFSTPTSYTTGTSPRQIISADFNNDNNIDLAVSNLTAKSISILMGTNIGVFAPAITYTASLLTPAGLSTGYFNSDSYLDIAISSGNKIDFMLGTSTGSFVFQSFYYNGSNVVFNAAIDLNADNKLDLVAINSLQAGASGDRLLTLINGRYTITAIASPTITCLGSPVPLSSNGSILYNWSTGATTNSISVNPTITTTYSVTGSNYASCELTTSITVSVSACVGIIEMNGSIPFGISIYPNPNNGVFTIETEIDTSLEIVDVLGNLIQSKKINAGKNQINLSDKSAGVYFLKTPNQVVKKVVVN